MTANTSQIAGRLRQLADALDLLSDDVALTAYVSLSDLAYPAGQTQRTTVDTVADAFGLTPKPEKQGSDYWQYAASDDREGVTVRVWTQMTAPARRCACGAECTHTDPSGAA
jgi:hypothetical protein